MCSAETWNWIGGLFPDTSNDINILLEEHGERKSELVRIKKTMIPIDFGVIVFLWLNICENLSIEKSAHGFWRIVR